MAPPATPTPPRPIWLDTDPGFDDWLTMLMLAADEQVDWIGTSVVAGNAPLPTTLDNALRICHHYGVAAPVFAGCDKPLAGPIETAQRVLGPQGMHTTGDPLPPCPSIKRVGSAPACTTLAPPNAAVPALLHALRHSPSPVTLIAIGPLTTIATALQCAPDLKPHLHEIVLMGGSTDRGNHTPAAEFNIYADPDAADIVFNAGVPLRMFGLNVCRQVLLTQAEVQQVRHWPGQRAQWLAGYLDAYQRIRSADGSVPMPLYDPVVSAWLAAPDLFEFSPARVDIELTGRFTRGMTVCDFKPDAGRPFNAQVAMLADGPAVVALMLERLRRVVGQAEISGK